MEISFNSILFIPLIFLWLQSFYIPGTRVPIYSIVMGVVFFLILIYYFPKLLSVKKFFKYNFFRILILYIGWVFLSGFILVCTGVYAAPQYLYGTFTLFFFNNFTWYIYPYILYSKHYTLKYFIKFILIGIYILCLWGILLFVLKLLHINFLEPIQQFINSRRLIDTSSTRIESLFEEPGHFGSFICMNLPIIYNMILSKYKILKNDFLNTVFKKSYIPILWLTIIFIQSPIWLIFNLLVTIIYFHKKLFDIKIITTFIIGTVIGVSYILFSDIEQTFLNRIILTKQSLGNLEELVIKEPSLANRIINYRARLHICSKYPITGVGYKNTEYVAISAFNQLRIPLTEETIRNIAEAKNNYMLLNGTLLYNSLSDTGIVGFLLFYLFAILLILKAKQLTKLLPISFEQKFLEGLSNTYIVSIAFSFYDLRVSFTYYWFILGILLCYIKYYQDNKVQFRMITNKKL